MPIGSQISCSLGGFPIVAKQQLSSVDYQRLSIDIDESKHESMRRKLDLMVTLELKDGIDRYAFLQGVSGHLVVAPLHSALSQH